MVVVHSCLQECYGSHCREVVMNGVVVVLLVMIVVVVVVVVTEDPVYLVDVIMGLSICPHLLLLLIN